MQIDEAPFPLQLVHGRLARPVLCGQPAQCGYFVVRIVIDVRLWMITHMGRQEVEQVRGEACLFVMVVGPEIDEVPATSLPQPDAVEIFQSAVRVVGIALDVVEQIALVRLGQQVEPAPFHLIAQHEPGFAARPA